MKGSIFKKAITLFSVYKLKQLNSSDLDEAKLKAPNLKEMKDDFNTLVSMGKDTYSGDYKMNKWNLSVIVGTIVYVVSPLDAVPDLIPVLGWLDDVTIVGYSISKLTEEIKKYKEFKGQSNQLAK
ncbi:YkvA family protein [Sphingobacterium hungaricum]|uniref:DUF1232 domain-containing protein n=1 Tax=Sphingobacterium hungaricum TaxID=2082723 RepID=A0A928US40_9SPHI|nr:YkvA family protein [Sphingobacterium hungaricum]MBE8712180.1 hypothetical protein [Sphingobacterium hungaricum]